MSDEQTRLLQQILDTQKESLAFAKQQRDEFMAIQQTAIARQEKHLRMSRFAIAFMLIAVGLVVILAVMRSEELLVVPHDPQNQGVPAVPPGK